MNKKKIKFYVNPRLIFKDLSCIPLLRPLLGDTSKRDYIFEFFEDYNYNTSYYELVDDIKEADFVLVPHRYNVLIQKRPEAIKQYTAEAHKYNKPILIDGTGDIEEDINIKDAYILRIGGYRFNSKDYEIIVPPYSEDLLEKYLGGVMVFRDKTKVPIIGFSGWATFPFKQYVRSFIKELPLRFVSLFNEKYEACIKGVFFRSKIIKILKCSTLINTNFLVRKSYSGHKSTAEESFKKLRDDFIENLVNSDYGLSIRGDANASMRLFEILSLGRIPLLIDTECRLPLSDLIDYTEFCVVVDYKDMKNTDKIIRSFHDNISDEEFNAMQIKAREVFKNYFRIDNFTKHLMEKLSKIALRYN